jgi:hypothetical protein
MEELSRSSIELEEEEEEEEETNPAVKTNSSSS